MATGAPAATVNTITRPALSSLELLQIEECDAWFEYLDSTRDQKPIRYREVEPWAWSRLQQRRKAIAAERVKLA